MRLFHCSERLKIKSPPCFLHYLRAEFGSNLTSTSNEIFQIVWSAEQQEHIAFPTKPWQIELVIQRHYINGDRSMVDWKHQNHQ